MARFRPKSAITRAVCVVTGVLLIGGLGGCHGKRETRAKSAPEQESAAVLAHYADLAFAEYSDAVAGAEELALRAKELAESPSAEALSRARAAWVRAREPYLQTEAFRFYDGPIDGVEGHVNSWPIDENYVEASADKPGIIDDARAFPTLSRALLRSLNEKEGEKNISTGFHVIEFLLWGRDENPDGPGGRSHEDYVNAPRRGAYLRTATELLVEHLERVRDAWSPKLAGNYRTRFLAMPHEEALGLVVKGMGTLSGAELGGERLTVAYATKDQENEHSCFSDTTTTDVVLDALGIENVALGRYTRSDGSALRGPSLLGLLNEVEPELAADLRSELAASVSAARAIPAPFDRAIMGKDTAPGRVAISRTIAALEAQTTSLSRAASVLGATVAFDPPRGQ